MIDYGKIVDAILNEDYHRQRRGEPVEVDTSPVGLNEYFLSNHSKNLHTIETFDFSNEWIESQPELHNFLKEELDDWWGDQTHDDPEVFRNWLDGNKILVYPDPYLDTLIEDLLKAYRERITETWTCEECGKEISEKHPLGHADSIARVGVPDPEAYPDGKIPEGVSMDTVEWTKHIYCDRCWRKLFLNRNMPIKKGDRGPV